MKTTRHLIPSIGERNFWIVIDLWCHPRHQKTVSQSFLWNRVTVDVPLSHEKPDSGEWSYSGHSEHSYTGRLTWPLSIYNVHRWAVLLKAKKTFGCYVRTVEKKKKQNQQKPRPHSHPQQQQQTKHAQQNTTTTKYPHIKQQQYQYTRFDNNASRSKATGPCVIHC